MQVRAALSDIRTDPERGMAAWAADAEVQRALDLLEATLGGSSGGGGSSGVVDVSPET